MTATDIRTQLADVLTAALPRRGYFIVPDERSLNTLDRRTVIISQQGFSPSTVSPTSLLTVRFTVRVISPKTDLMQAEQDASDAASDVCAALTKLGTGITWTDASKVLAKVSAAEYLAYDISVEATTRITKEQTP
jgi:hypothetical protein